MLDLAEYDLDDREAVVIDDPDGCLPNPYKWGYDGWADDNCDLTITVSVYDWEDCSGVSLPSDGPAIIDCAEDDARVVRVIARRWTAVDGAEY